MNIKLLIKKQIVFSKHIYIMFIDLKKTFDIVPWKELFQTLSKINIDFKAVYIIYVSEKSETAEIRKRNKIEYLISLILFDIYIK